MTGGIRLKKITCIFLSVLMLIYFPTVSYSANESLWEAEYTKIITQTNKTQHTKYILTDIDFDGIPELFIGDNDYVFLYTQKNNSAIKLSEFNDISINYFERMKLTQKHQNTTEFIGQITDKTDVITYKIIFSDGIPHKETIAVEKSDRSGIFYENQQTPLSVSDCSSVVSNFLAQYSFEPYTICILTAGEMHSSVNDAIASFFNRYKFLNSLSDDTTDFLKTSRDNIKKAVGNGKFLNFDKISRLNNTDALVQFYITDTVETDELQPSVDIPYTKIYALVANVDTKPTVSAIYNNEIEFDTDFLSSIKTRENELSNINIDYSKTSSFRGIDDYITYLNSILSSAESINENGKKNISEYIEYATNRCSRTEIKAKNNTITVSSYAVSFIAENAADCAKRLNSLCESNNVSLNRKARIIPEVICSDLDMSKPIRIEYEPKLSENLFAVSGLRLMLSDNIGIYIATPDLSVLENSFDMFCAEYKITESGFSVVFSDKSNNAIDYINAPVWFIAPAESQYSTVMASFSGGTNNWGGQFDPKNKTIEFSTNYSGDYDIVENDITINDIDSLPSSTKDAIRFIVSKGIISLDKRNNFNPNKTLSRYDFTTALVKMFYATNQDAVSTFTDIPKNNVYYTYIASAEEQNVATGYADGTFRGKNPVSKEQVVALCGRTLVEKKDYTYPENYEGYLNFTDTDLISPWAKSDIAVAARSGLIYNTGLFLPSDSVTRAEGAEILYKTFMLLYDVSPVTTVSSLQNAEEIQAQQPNNEIYDFEFRLAMCILLTVIMLFTFYIIIKINKKRNKNNTA